MEFSELVRRRGMVRSFKDRQVEHEKLVKILSNAVRAPSAGHLQPWEFIVVKDDGVKRSLAEAALKQMFIAEAPVVIVTCVDTERSASRYGDRGRRFYSIIDGAYASLLILLTARDLGLGACFVGAYRDEDVARVLELPRHVRPIGIIPIGYPAEKPPRYERLPLEQLVHLNRYGNRADIEEL
ncbi:FMN reductase (NADPH) [archaeon HR04]|nr:FMN reductase (NADPH) [archaeon HR04]